MQKDKKSIKNIVKLLHEMEIPSCDFSTIKQLKWKDIDSVCTDNDDQFELDCFAVIKKTGVLIEVTTQASKIKSYLKKKINIWNRFVDCFKNNSKKVIDHLHSKYGFSDEFLAEVKSIKEWKYLCVVCDYNISISSTDFGTLPKHNLTIINQDEIDYLKAISKSLGKYARNEVYGILDFDLTKIGESRNISYKFLKVSDKVVIKGRNVLADVYQCIIPVSDLLEFARVYRFGSLIEKDEEEPVKGYQRLISSTKLRSMAKVFLESNSKKMYPTPITVILSADSEEVKVNGIEEIRVSTKFASAEIIDGQHRLYSYITEFVKEDVRSNAVMLVTAIKFSETDLSKIRKNSAQLFIEINGTQSRVKKSLEYLLLWDVLGMRTRIAMASKIIVETAKIRKSPLYELFEIRPTRKFCESYKVRTLPITTVINEYSQHIKVFFTSSKVKKSDCCNLMKMFNLSIEKLKLFSDEDKEKIVKIGTDNLIRFFICVSEVFSEDWKAGSKSSIFSSNYISSFIRIKFKLINDGCLDESSWKDRLTKIKKDVSSKLKLNDNVVVFSEENEDVLPKKSGISPIFEWMVSK